MTLAQNFNEDEVFMVLSDQDREGYTLYGLNTNPEDASTSTDAFNLYRRHTRTRSVGLSRYLIDPQDLPPHLSQSHIHVVISSGSGTGKAISFWQGVMQPLLEALRIPHVGDNTNTVHRRGKHSHLITSQAGSVKEFAASQLKFSSEAKTVILLSGDGGVADLLNWGPAAGGSQGATETAATSENIPADASGGRESLSKHTIALIPLGTGNALFHSLHKPAREPAGEVRGAEKEEAPIPSPLVLALRTLLRGTTRDLPAFRTTFSPGARLIAVPTGEQSGGSGSSTNEEKEDDANPISSPSSPSPAATTAAKVAGRYLPVPPQGLLGTIVISYGFHASLVHASDTPSLRKFGARRFAMAAADLMKIGHEYQAQVEYLPLLPPCSSVSSSFSSSSAAMAQQVKKNLPADYLKTWVKIPRQKHAYVLVAHVSNMERTFEISPLSKPLDGRLWLVHFAPVDGGEMMRIMGAAYAGGKHVGMELGGNEGNEMFDSNSSSRRLVGYLPVKGVRVRIEKDEDENMDGTDGRWRVFCVDGAIVEVEGKGKGWMEVKGGEETGLKVLVPEGVGNGRRE